LLKIWGSGLTINNLHQSAATAVAMIAAAAMIAVAAMTAVAMTAAAAMIAADVALELVVVDS